LNRYYTFCEGLFQDSYIHTKQKGLGESFHSKDFLYKVYFESSKSYIYFEFEQKKWRCARFTITFDKPIGKSWGNTKKIVSSE